MKKMLICLIASLPTLSWAVTAVNPNGVNVNATGPTTVFLTFQGTQGQLPVDAFWCGDITVGANTVTATNPCVPGTLFGHLPPQNNLARQSGTAGQVNTTDIMTIPATVARRAYQDAQRGNASQFFYVRQFRDTNGQDQFIAVTCRLAGGGARVPLAITRVDLAFGSLDDDTPVRVFERGEAPPPVIARVMFNGSGRFKGRWEVVKPGDPEPQPRDLLSEASLPLEERNLQRRYTEVGLFDLFLPPSGTVFLPSPDVTRIPTQGAGQYKLLLRIEATADKEGASQTNAGVAQSGGVAGFALPVLRYAVAGVGREVAPEQPLPFDLNMQHDGEQWVARWRTEPRDQLLLLAFDFADERPPFEAVVPLADGVYRLPPWWQADQVPRPSISLWQGTLQSVSQ